MKKAAFASVAVLAVIALSASSLLSQPAQEQAEPRERDTQEVREVTSEELAAELRDEYVRLSELKAQSMSVDELQQAVREMEWLKVQKEFAPIIQQLRDVTNRRPDSVTRLKAEVAIDVLRSGDERKLHSIQRLLETDFPAHHSSRP